MEAMSNHYMQFAEHSSGLSPMSLLLSVLLAEFEPLTMAKLFPLTTPARKEVQMSRIVLIGGYILQ